jgi:hypothetical protein
MISYNKKSLNYVFFTLQVQKNKYFELENIFYFRLILNFDVVFVFLKVINWFSMVL